MNVKVNLSSVIFLCRVPSLQLERKGLNLPTSEAVSKKAKKLDAAKNFEFKDEDIEHVRVWVCGGGVCVCGVCVCTCMCVCVCVFVCVCARVCVRV